MMKILFSFVIIALCAVNAERTTNFGGYNMEKAYQLAKECDKGGDNQIDLEEFKKCFIKLEEGEGKGTTFRESSENDLNAIFKLFDVSQNGELDNREFAIGITLHEEYKYYDENNDNQLSTDELMTTVDILGDTDKTASFPEYFHRIYTDTKLSENWQENLGKSVN